jgi:WD40 repeat protein
MKPSNPKRLLMIVLITLAVAALAWWYGTRLPKPDLLATFPCSDGEDGVAFAPDGETLAVARGSEIALLNVPSIRVRAVFKGHKREVLHLAFSADGKLLAAGDEGGSVRIWDVVTGTERAVCSAEGTTAVRSVAFSPDGSTLAARGRQDVLGFVNGVAQSGMSEINLWDVGTGNRIATLIGHTHYTKRLAFAPDGKTLASASYDETVILWDVANRTKRTTLKGHRGAIFGLAYAPDSKMVASCTYDGIRLWDADTGNQLANLRGWAGTPHSLAFAPDGKILAAGCGDPPVLFFKSSPGEVELWDVETRKVRSRWKVHGSWVTAVAFSPDGKLLATRSRSGVEVWDLSRIIGQNPGK